MGSSSPVQHIHIAVVSLWQNVCLDTDVIDKHGFIVNHRELVALAEM